MRACAPVSFIVLPLLALVARSCRCDRVRKLKRPPGSGRSVGARRADRRAPTLRVPESRDGCCGACITRTIVACRRPVRQPRPAACTLASAPPGASGRQRRRHARRRAGRAGRSPASVASTRSVTGATSGCTPPLASAAARQAAGPAVERSRDRPARRQSMPVRGHVDHDGVTVLDQGDRARPGQASGATWPMTRPTEPPEKRASVIKRDGDIALAAQRRDPRGGVEQLGHARGAPRALVADDHHVVVARTCRGAGRARR